MADDPTETPPHDPRCRRPARRRPYPDRWPSLAGVSLKRLARHQSIEMASTRRPMAGNAVGQMGAACLGPSGSASDADGAAVDDGDRR